MEDNNLNNNKHSNSNNSPDLSNNNTTDLSNNDFTDPSNKNSTGLSNNDSTDVSNINSLCFATEGKIVVPAATYLNSDTQKLDILNNNQGKTGVYRWTSRESGKSYVGSSVDLKARLKNYFNISYLEGEFKRNKSLIYRAILKHGYSGFSLDILEYCDVTALLEREQYYLDLYKPEYNLRKFAFSNLGLKHTEATKDIMRLNSLGRTHTDESKAKMVASCPKSQGVIITDNNTREAKELLSIRRAAEYIGVHHSVVAKYIRKQNFYRGKQYTVSKKNTIAG